MSQTSRALKALLDGRDVVVVDGCAPAYEGRGDKRWPVVHDPRHPNDPVPWVAFGTERRFSGGEVEVLPANDNVRL